MESQLRYSLKVEDIQLIQLIAKTAADLDFPSYLVGGIVRDILLDRKITDFDIVLEGNSIPLVKKLEKIYGGRQISHSRFGTAKWMIDPTDLRLISAVGLNTGGAKHTFPECIDLISARSETYAQPAVLPKISTGSLQDDLLRRDFTINAMAVRIDGEHFGELIDPWGGQEDLYKKQIRILHDKSFIDDPTRILRAVRFEKRLGFRLEDKTSALLVKSLGYLKHVNGARIRNELEHILDEDNRIFMLARLRDLKVLTSIHPGLVWTPQVELSFKNATLLKEGSFGKLSLKAGMAFIIWFITFPEEQSLSICKRLCLPVGLTKAIQSAQSLWKQKERIGLLSNSDATFFLDNYDLAAIFALTCFPLGKRLNYLLENYLEKWRFVKPISNGTTLKEMGIPAGPRYKLLLKELRAAWLDENIKNIQEERAFLATLLNKK
jgi:tRNA nucleotidyltransferase (CCA-adding enzyme)